MHSYHSKFTFNFIDLGSVGLRISVALAIFQTYREFEAGDTQLLRQDPGSIQ